MALRIITATLAAVVAVIALVITGHDVYALLAYKHVSPKLGWVALLAPSMLLLVAMNVAWKISDRRRQRRTVR